jgi:5,10-methenyltetrahydromethanopterin hydrogenase
MDPNACMGRMMHAIITNDYAEARDAAHDLIDWLNKGGVEPTLNGPQLRTLVQATYERLSTIAAEEQS